ncbi:MAG: hypothetical protein V3U37_00195 [Nitrospinaceae bacterium]
MHNSIIILIHLMAAAVAIGGSAFCLLLFLPAMEKLPPQNTPEEHSVAYKTMEILSPTVFACLLILIGSGVYYLLSNYTAQYGFEGNYFNLFGIKMLFAAAAFILSIYQAFFLRARISDLDLKPEARELVPATLRKMRTLTGINLGLITIALFLGIWLARF